MHTHTHAKRLSFGGIFWKQQFETPHICPYHHSPLLACLWQLFGVACNFGILLLLLCFGEANAEQSACGTWVLTTPHVPGFRNRVFIMALWSEEKGVNVGPQSALSSQLAVLHSQSYIVGYLLKKLLGSHWHVIIDVVCLQQINNKQLGSCRQWSVKRLFRQFSSAGGAVKLHCWLLIGLLLFIYYVALFFNVGWCID